MDADGNGFSFPGADFSRSQDASDPMSWGDIFLDSIVADDPAPTDSNDGGSGISDNVLGPSTPQQVLQQSSQSSGIGQQFQIQLAQQKVNQQVISDSGTNIPTHLQATLTNNGGPQCNTSSVGGSVAYLAPSISSQHQQISSGGSIQNVLAANQPPAAVTVSQGGTKLVQLGPSFPVAALPNSVPLQTLLQPGHQIAGQTIYGGQNPGLFPAQGAVHIENPKVVNVNFGPHVIQPDGSGQQTIIQTAQGKGVLITNSQLQHLPQSLSLTQPIVGTQLIQPAGSSVNNVIRTTVAQATPTLVPSSTTSARQILLPTGQTVIPRQSGNPQAGLSKNVLLRPLNSGVQPVIYQSGQGNVAGQLIPSQPALLATSGAGLQVVNTGANQGSQVQLIAQPSLNQATMGQQQLNQNTLMNIIGNQNVLPNSGSQLPGLMHGQNIVVNGQMLNLSQVGGLTLPLQVQGNNSPGTVTVAGINSGNRQFGTSNQQQMIIQQPNGQQQIMIQPKNTPSPSITRPSSGGSQRSSYQPKSAQTPTPSANSASSTPAPTPTPSTPTPTPTPDLNLSDFGNSGSKSSQNINILEEALKLSSIDLQNYEDDDFNFFNDPVGDSIASITPPPAPVTPSYPKVKPQPAPKPKGKNSKAKAKPTQAQPIVNVTVNNNLLSQSAQNQNSQAQKVNISPQQKIITASGQVYVISANGQQLVLQQTPPTSKIATPAPTTKDKTVQSAAVSTTPSTFASASPRSSINIPVGNHRSVKSAGEPPVVRADPMLRLGQPPVKSEGLTSLASASSKSTQSQSTSGGQMFFKGGPGGTLKAQTVTSSSELLPQIPTAASTNQKHVVQVKNQQISTLAGKIIKQEPIVKQEPPLDVKPDFSFFDPLQQSQQSATVFPTTSVVSVNAPHIGSASSALSTTLTLTQHSTIMSTVSTQSQAGNQGHVNATTVSHTASVKTTSIVQDVASSQSPPLTTSSNSSSSSSKNLKGKGASANIKALTQIKIANTTLKLSLTPMEKMRLETQISDMSIEKQEQLLSHQQKIISRSQDLQKKQQEQKRLIIHKHKEIQQSLPPAKPTSVAATPVTNSVASMPEKGKMAIGGKSTATTPLGLPTTVQELMEKNDKGPATGSVDKSTSQQPQPAMQQDEKPLSAPHDAHTPQKFVSPQSQASILHTARCLRAEQQLHRDCTLALAPDTQTPFKNLADAMRRLVRYHTLQDHKPDASSDMVKEWDGKYKKTCERLMKKKRCFMRRFTKMMLYKDMCREQWPDYVQNLKSFNESLKEHLDGEKEEALNNPETFQPLQPELLMPSADRESESEGDYISEEEDDENSDHSVDDHGQNLPWNGPPVHIEPSSRGQHDLVIKREIKSEPVESTPSTSIYCVSSLKRKHEDKPSSGTLKLVLKRKTTDNFVVKSSSHDMGKVPGDFKPVVDMEICDSLYEYDSKSGVTRSDSVLVRRRDSLMSQTSRRSSEQEGDSRASFNSSQNREDEEDDEESFNDAEGDEEEEEDSEHSSSENEESGDEEMDEFPQSDNGEADNSEEGLQDSDNAYYQSFSEEIGSEQSCSLQLEMGEKKPDLDAFTESSSQWATEPVIDSQQDGAAVETNNAHAKYSDISSSDQVSATGSSRTSKKSFSSSDLTFGRHRMSVASDDVFISNPGFHHGDEEMDLHSRKGSASDLHDLINKAGDSFIPGRESSSKFPEFSTSSIHSSRSETPLHELVATSPASHLETAAASGQLLPSSALFTTPNKNLLQTDYVMFNSSEDEDDDKNSAMSSFKIDNKDPQSSMINDSVRTAINSVINNDDDDDDNMNENSQTGWATAHRRSSFFHPSLSSSVSPSHDSTLEAAVENMF